LDNSAPRAECGNCGTTLTGPYCSACGQHAHGSARSVAALFHDAWHLFTHVDDRLWQSLHLLLFRPGRLTQEYFADHRARYLPPVRLYLVLSVLFFAFGLATPEKTSLPPVAAPDAAAPSKAAPQPAAAGKAPAAREKSRSTILDIDNCDDIKIPVTWLQNSLRQSCVRNKGDNGVSVQHAFIATIPKMMFLFVPMMALVMLILYWRPMVESGAIIELILAREGRGRLEPAVNSPDYPYYLQWMHFAEGSFAARVIADYRVALIQGKPKTPDGGYKLVDTEAVLKFMEDYLSKHPYFGGAQFSAADIMMLFPTNITEAFNVADLAPYPHVIAWRASVESRPAYKKMLIVARPDGVPGAPKPLPKT
jgi:glutathione S-transferase